MTRIAAVLTLLAIVAPAFASSVPPDPQPLPDQAETLITTGPYAGCIDKPANRRYLSQETIGGTYMHFHPGATPGWYTEAAMTSCPPGWKYPEPDAAPLAGMARGQHRHRGALDAIADRTIAARRAIRDGCEPKSYYARFKGGCNNPASWWVNHGDPRW